MNATEVHRTFLDALGPGVLAHGDIQQKPLNVDLALPLPPRLRVYAYSLVSAAGTSRKNEYKAVLRISGQVVNTYASFDHSEDRFAIVAAYRQDLNVFVLWDASLHPRFKNGGNIQVKDTTVLNAAATGYEIQLRTLATGVTEVVIACIASNLRRAISERIYYTGGITEGEWEHWRN
jgi:hypothetical protein